MNKKIHLRLDHNVTYIDGRMYGPIYQEFKKKLGYRPENYIWMKENIKKKREKIISQNKLKNMPEWDGWISTVCYNKEHCKCFTPKSGTHFPTGLISKAREFFIENNIDYQIEDVRQKYEINSNVLSMSSEFEIRDYQLEVVEKALKQTRGIIQCATGAGKTAIFANLISRIGVFPVIVYVISKDLLYQTKNELERFILKNNKNIEVGIIGDGKKDIKDINIMTVQTAVIVLGGTYKKFDDEEREEKIEDFYKNDNEIINLIKNSKIFVADESHHWASESCQMIADASEKCQYRFAFSATPYRNKNDDILIEGCFGKMIIKINASYLIKRGYLVKPEITFIHIDNMNKIKYSSYNKIYKYGIIQNEIRNEWIKKLAISLYKDKRNILILCRQIEHGNILEDIIPDSFFIHGSHTKKQRLEHLDKMRKGESGIIIASQIFDEGINVPVLDTLILTGGGHSATRALQRIGRTLRFYPGKKKALIFDFMDDCRYLRDHSHKRRKMYKTESEFIIKDAYKSTTYR